MKIVTQFIALVFDYLHVLYKHGRGIKMGKPPAHYLGYVQEGKAPIILIPGIYERWHALSVLAEPLSRNGHPIYSINNLGYNTRSIPETARIVREFIEKENLYNVIIIAHSKGGLIGKYLLAFKNQDQRIKKVIAIATPFGGSTIVRLIPHKAIKEFHPQSHIIKLLQAHSEVNHQIVSVYGTFDNYVRPLSSCNLEGAKNIQVDVRGHNKILFDTKVKALVFHEVSNF